MSCGCSCPILLAYCRQKSKIEKQGQTQRQGDTILNSQIKYYANNFELSFVSPQKQLLIPAFRLRIKYCVPF